MPEIRSQRNTLSWWNITISIIARIKRKSIYWIFDRKPGIELCVGESVKHLESPIAEIMDEPLPHVSLDMGVSDVSRYFDRKIPGVMTQDTAEIGMWLLSMISEASGAINNIPSINCKTCGPNGFINNQIKSKR